MRYHREAVLLFREEVLCRRAVSQHEQGGQLVGGVPVGVEGACADDEVLVGVEKGV